MLGAFIGGVFSSMGQKPAIDYLPAWVGKKAHLCASPKATFSCRDGSGDGLLIAFFAHTPTWLILSWSCISFFSFLVFPFSSFDALFIFFSFYLISFLKLHFALLHLGKIAVGRNRRRIWGRKAMFMICKYTQNHRSIRTLDVTAHDEQTSKISLSSRPLRYAR